MPIKPEPVTNLFHPLANGGAMQLSGRDALAFAQAQFANDVSLLVDDAWQWSLWLSPKGRVIALFALLRLGPESLLLWLPDAVAAQLAEQLLRFRFRSKLEITPLPHVSIAGSFASPVAHGFAAEGSRAAITRGAGGDWRQIVLDLGASQDRTLLLRAETDATTQSDPGTDARWRLQDIAHGLPRLGPEQVEAYTPQMLGLERLRAFSVKKGCYPGQEIVSRTHFLGQAKRSLQRFALNREAEPGARLGSDTGARAELICVARADARIEALAVAPVDISERFRSEDGQVEATPLPMLAGLAR